MAPLRASLLVHPGVIAALLYRSSRFACSAIFCPIRDDGSMLYGSLLLNPLSNVSASAIILTMGLFSDPWARLSLAVINSSTRTRLASPELPDPMGALRMANRSFLPYAWPPRLRESMGQAIRESCQNACLNGHLCVPRGISIAPRMLTWRAVAMGLLQYE